MNQTTARLLRKHASQSGKNYNDVKREWVAMNHIERSKARKAWEHAIKTAAKD